MGRAKLNDGELADRVLDLFRNYGYQGTTLSQIAEATGLEKASLYYRYPGGKEAIVLAVASRVGSWFEENVFHPLIVEGTPKERLDAVARSLREFYGDGERPCVLESLSLPGGPSELRFALRQAMEQWLRAFTMLALEGGLGPDEAARGSEQALIDIEGSLVMGRVLGESRFFLRAIEELPKRLLAPRKGKR